LEYGWRLKNIFLYSDEDCSTNRMITTFSGAEISSDDFLDLNQVLTSSAGVSAGVWSLTLNVNPVEVDGSHGDAIAIDITLPGGSSAADVRCIEVESRNLDGIDEDDKNIKEYYPETLAFYWGTGTQAYTGTHSFQDFVAMATATASIKDPQNPTDGVIHQVSFNVGAYRVHPMNGVEHSTEMTASPLYCKQLAIDRYDIGARFWYWQENKECVLLRSRTEHETCHQQNGNYLSGDVGVRVDTFSPTTVDPGQTFDLTLEGALMRSSEFAEVSAAASQQRIKLVEITNGDASCDSPDSSLVRGYKCHNGLICNNKPSDVSDTSITFSGMSIFPAGESQWKVCYNPGVVWDRLQWVTVQDSTGAALVLTVDGLYKWELVDGTAVTERPTIASIATIMVYRVDGDDIGTGALREPDVKVVKKTEPCTASETVNTVTAANVMTPNGNTMVVMAQVHPDAPAGQYRICFSDYGSTVYSHISSEFAAYLTVTAEVNPTAGFYQNQKFSDVVSDSVEVTIQGFDFASVCSADTVCLGLGSTDATADILAEQSTTVTCSGLSSSVTATFDATAANAGLTADLADSSSGYHVFAKFGACDTGTYTVVGRLLIQSNVRNDHNWVVSPGLHEESAIEVLGTGLVPKDNRIMITACTSSCGAASPSSSAYIHGYQASQEMYNFWLPHYLQTDDPQNSTEYGYVVPGERRGIKFARYQNMGCDSDYLTFLDSSYDHLLCSECATSTSNAACAKGYFASTDGSDSMAYCMTAQQAHDIMQAGGANSFVRNSAAAAEKRFYFYTSCGEGGEDHRTADFSGSQYDLYWESDEADAATGTVPTSCDNDADSWNAIIRWSGLSFESGGEYKVCMCEDDCQEASDYNIEVGKIHVSGVSCLLAEPVYQNGCCKETTLDQYGYGGYSCWSGECPTWPTCSPSNAAPMGHDVEAYTPPNTALTPQTNCENTPEEPECTTVMV